MYKGVLRCFWVFLITWGEATRRGMKGDERDDDGERKIQQTSGSFSNPAVRRSPLEIGPSHCIQRPQEVHIASYSKLECLNPFSELLDAVWKRAADSIEPGSITCTTNKAFVESHHEWMTFRPVCSQAKWIEVACQSTRALLGRPTISESSKHRAASGDAGPFEPRSGLCLGVVGSVTTRSSSSSFGFLRRGVDSAKV